MDIVQGQNTQADAFTSLTGSDWASYLINSNRALLYQFIPYASQLTSITSTIQAWITPLLEQIIQKPDLATIALLLVILYVSLMIFNMVWSSIKFWLRMVYNIAFWGGLAAAGLWMWTRGPDGVADDIQHWANVWNQNYEHWTEQERIAKLSQQRVNYGQARNNWF